MKIRYLILVISLLLFTANVQVGAQAKKKVIFEMFTSAACGNCPTGIGEIERILNEYGDDCIIWVSHHAGWLWDPMLFPEINTIANDFASGAPTGMIDRTNNLGTTWLATTPSTWEDQIVDALALPAKASISFSGGYDEGSRNLDFSVTARFESSVSAGDLRFNVMILENNVNEGTSNYNQSNYFNNTPGHPFEGAGNPIVGYLHKNVTRAVLDDAWGTDGIIPDNPAINTNYTANYSYTLPENFDETQISIVAFISYYDDDANNRQVINGDEIHINDLVTTSTEELSFLESFEVRPNPADYSTTLRANSLLSKTVNLQIMAVDGKILIQRKADLFTGENYIPLELSGLAAGTYMVVLDDGIERATRRLVVR